MLNKVRIKLVDAECLGSFYFNQNPDITSLAKSLRNRYTVAATIECGKNGEDAAEEMFDLTNNPGRDEDRARLYGRQRSVSVGDKVEVNGVEYLCAPTGWIKI